MALQNTSEKQAPSRAFLACILACGLLAALLPGLAFAEEIPKPGKADPRIKFVDYRSDDVVRIVGQFGYATNITFDEGETVTSAVLGDTLAWEVAPAANHVFVKPREIDARTNMTVLTDKGRTYTFYLATAPKAQKSQPEDLFFRVIFHYPQEAAKQETQLSAAAVAEKLLDKPRRDIRNVEYLACGSEAVTPDQAFDDGRFTFLRYAGAREIPAVFVVNPDGSEGLVDTHMEGDTVVVHRLAQRFVFRHGETVGCLVNKRFDAKGVETFNGTVAEGVERVLRGARP